MNAIADPSIALAWRHLQAGNHKVADEIVEGEINDPDFQRRMAAAIDRVMKRLGKKGKRR